MICCCRSPATSAAQPCSRGEPGAHGSIATSIPARSCRVFGKRVRVRGECLGRVDGLENRVRHRPPCQAVMENQRDDQRQSPQHLHIVACIALPDPVLAAHDLKRCSVSTVFSYSSRMSMKAGRSSLGRILHHAVAPHAAIRASFRRRRLQEAGSSRYAVPTPRPTMSREPESCRIDVGSGRGRAGVGQGAGQGDRAEAGLQEGRCFP